jgi:hypothetical protein
LVRGARNILVMGAGQDRGDADAAVDAAVLLHLSVGRDRAAVIGVPRNLRVPAPPGCAAAHPKATRQAGVGASVESGAGAPGGAGTAPRTGSGAAAPAVSPGPPRQAQPLAAPAAAPAVPLDESFGAVFRQGGAACSIRAFEVLTGIRVDHHLVVDVDGYRRIAAAAGGRTRDRRGELLRALAREARGGDGGLAHPARLYGFLDSATSGLHADPGLSSLPALYELAGSLRALPPDGLVFRTVPAGSRGEVREPAAGGLFAAVRADRPLGGERPGGARYDRPHLGRPRACAAGARLS